MAIFSHNNLSSKLNPIDNYWHQLKLIIRKKPHFI